MFCGKLLARVKCPGKLQLFQVAEAMNALSLALPFALDRAGRSIPARIAITAMTTNSSMRVKPEADLFCLLFMVLLPFIH